MTYAEFVEKYEVPATPCLISGLGDHWPLMKYDAASLAKSKYADVKFKVHLACVID